MSTARSNCPGAQGRGSLQRGLFKGGSRKGLRAPKPRKYKSNPREQPNNNIHPQSERGRVGERGRAQQWRSANTGV